MRRVIIYETTLNSIHQQAVGVLMSIHGLTSCSCYKAWLYHRIIQAVGNRQQPALSYPINNRQLLSIHQQAVGVLMQFYHRNREL